MNENEKNGKMFINCVEYFYYVFIYISIIKFNTCLHLFMPPTPVNGFSQFHANNRFLNPQNYDTNLYLIIRSYFRIIT